MPHSEEIRRCIFLFVCTLGATKNILSETTIFTYNKTCLKRPPHGARKNVIDRWSLPQNKPIFTKLCWTVTNVVVRTHLIYAMTIHVNPVQAVASCGSFFASLRCARGGCFDSKYGDKVTPFLAFCRQRQSLKSGGRLRQDPPLIWVFGHFWLFCTMV